MLRTVSTMLLALVAVYAVVSGRIRTASLTEYQAFVTGWRYWTVAVFATIGAAFAGSFYLSWQTRERVDRFVGFWQRCPDCGLRFGRHDENVDHPPF